MHKSLLGLACFLAMEMQALEHVEQYKDDQIGISRVKIFPHEEIGLHRDIYPQVVVALQGGILTRLEADGREVEVEFPTGVAVVREPDEGTELHRTVNRSSEPIELMITQLYNRNPMARESKKEDTRDIAVDIRINCPKGEEYDKFVSSIPKAGDRSESFEEWKSSFKANIGQLIKLVDSEQVFNSWWSVRTDDQAPK